MTFTIQLGSTPTQQVKQLQLICDSQLVAIFNHPAFTELLKDEPELETQLAIYLEAKTTLQHLAIPLKAIV